MFNITKINQGTPTKVRLIKLDTKFNITKINQGTPTYLMFHRFNFKFNITKINQGTPTFNTKDYESEGSILLKLIRVLQQPYLS